MGNGYLREMLVLARRVNYERSDIVYVYKHNGVLHGGEQKEADNCLCDIGTCTCVVYNKII